MQEFYVTPFSARKFLATFTYYLFEIQSQATSEKFYMIGNPLNDNERFSRFLIDTSINDATNGDIILSQSGLYTYTIFGQTSDTNLNPLDASVVGECEKGILQIIGESAWTIPDIVIPDNVVYYE